MDVLLAAAESLRTAEINEFHARAGKIQKLHVKRKRGVFRCDKCPSVFGLRHNLLRHERTIHQGRRPFKCDQPACNASFVQRFDLETHRSSVHDKRKDHRCPQCSRSFSQRSNLLTHVRITHDEPVLKPLPQLMDPPSDDSSAPTSGHDLSDHHSALTPTSDNMSSGAISKTPTRPNLPTISNTASISNTRPISPTRRTPSKDAHPTEP